MAAGVWACGHLEASACHFRQFKSVRGLRFGSGKLMRSKRARGNSSRIERVEMIGKVRVGIVSAGSKSRSAPQSQQKREKREQKKCLHGCRGVARGPESLRKFSIQPAKAGTTGWELFIPFCHCFWPCSCFWSAPSPERTTVTSSLGWEHLRSPIPAFSA